MTNLLKRGTSGLVYVALFISAILYAQESYLILTSIFGLGAIWEFSKLIKFRALFSFLMFIGFSALMLSGETDFQGIPILLAIALSGSLHVGFYLFSKEVNYPKSGLQKEDISIRYLVLSLIFLLLIPFSRGAYEPNIIIFTLLLIWTNDSFAFLVGVNFGKTKLYEKISPKKTVEGFVGGVFFTILLGVILSQTTVLFAWWHWVALALIISVIGTIGDLVESKFKRQAQIKDSGSIMPGHGGFLDRLDSLLFVAPFVYLYIHYLI